MFNRFRKKVDQSLFYFLPLIFLLTGCPSTRKATEQLRCDLPSIGYVRSNPSDKLDISINVDGSGSMIGYVTINNSNYIKTLDAIESVVDPNKNTTVEYKRIGDKKPLSRNDFRRDAKSRGFYDGTTRYTKVSSPIQEAIKTPSEDVDKLTLIVTDLEGDDGDLISETLRKHYFNQQIRDRGYTVGVWAVKTQFKGNIFNPNTGKVKFYYTTEGKKAKDYRPFYVLFIGKYDHIANYFNQINKLNSELANNSEMFIFPASNVVKEAINVGSLNSREKKIELPENNQLERVFSLEDENIIVSTENDDVPYELLEIVHEDKQVIPLNYQVSFPVLTNKDKGGIYSLAINKDQLRVKSKMFTFKQQAQTQLENEQLNDNIPKKSQEKDFFQVNSNVALQDALSIENLSLSNNSQTLNFVTNINLDNLSNPQIYLFEVDLILDNMQDPEWWQNWDSKNASNQDGSKTQNISLFMNKLEQLSLDSLRDKDNNAVIGRLCFAINKN